MEVWSYLRLPVHAQSLRRDWLFAIPWSVAHGLLPIFQQEYWSRLSLPLPGDLPDPEIEPESGTAGGFFAAEPSGKWPETSALIAEGII